MRFRSADELGAEHLGRRVTVRRALADGAKSDVIGILKAMDADTLTVVDRNNDTVVIRRADVVAARVIAKTI